jgi:hypothetical protein
MALLTTFILEIPFSSISEECIAISHCETANNGRFNEILFIDRYLYGAYYRVNDEA